MTGSRDPRHAPRIALLAPQTMRNLGDTATFAAAIAAYRRRMPEVDLVVVVPEPEDSARALRTGGFPLYGDGEFISFESAEAGARSGSPASSGGRLACMRRVFAFVGTCDAIVFTGGGLLDDFWGGPMLLPFWVLVWTLAARRHGVQVSFHAIGLDRLSSRWSRWMMLLALRLGHYRSFRDGQTQQMLADLGFTAPSEVLPDLAFALEHSHSLSGATEDDTRYVIVNPVAESMWTRGHDPLYPEYLDAFVGLCRTLLDRRIPVKLLSTQNRMDSPALAHVEAALRAEGRGGWERCEVTTLDQFMRFAGGARLIVSSRLHGLILGLVAGAPVVSVAPMRKMATLMEEVGLSDYCVPAAGLRSGELIARVERALAAERELRRQVGATVNELRRRLNAHFDRMFEHGLLGATARAQFLQDGSLATRSAQ